MRRFLLLCAIAALLPLPVGALGPHEILLLANANSEDSVRIARAFARLRQVPERNLVLLPLPRELGRATASIQPGDFSRWIWEPALRAAATQGIADHILAWVYSVDFPVRVSVLPAVSIQGLTFLRNRLPDPVEVEKGTYASPLFAGPMNETGRAYPSQTFDQMKRWLGDEMPLPSMMLGVAGERGNSTKEILACLRRGGASDGTAPKGTVYLLKGEDIRASCRQWQFRSARRELTGLGVRVRVASELPEGGDDLVGVLMGAAHVRPPRQGYLPGCVAEHLTSAGAVFDSKAQTKLSAWIGAGATASAGAVTEPYANWMKFPCAHHFVHYASGCTVIESLFQGLRCPLQILLVGDPLAAPWAEKAELLVRVPESAALAGNVLLAASVKAAPAAHYARFLWLVDGRVAGDGTPLEWDTATVEDGEHQVRAVAYRTGMVSSQVFNERTVKVRNGR